jgi:hypothetical protein
MKDEANRGAQPMHRNRRHPLAIAVLSLVSLVAVLAVVQNVELDEQNDVADGIARIGIEGEGDIPLPIAEA